MTDDNTLIKLGRTEEHIIKALGRVLEQEDLSNPYTSEYMMRQVMNETKGQVSPTAIKRYIDRIMKDRY